MVKQNVLFNFNIILKIIVVVATYILAIIEWGTPGERADILIIQIIGFVLGFFIISSYLTNDYKKFKTSYYASILGELFVIFVFSLIIAAWIAMYPLNFTLLGFSFMTALYLMSITASIMGLKYFFLKRAEIRGIKPKPDILEKLKEILNVSNKIKLKRVQNVLNLNDKSFDEKIIEWANEFGFRIDGESLIVNKESIPEFIEALDEKFIEWEQLEKDRSSKL